MPEESVVLPDISEQVTLEGKIQMDFLLPNGVFLPLEVEFHRPLDLLKQDLWREAEQYPLYQKLKRYDSYLFVFLNQDGQREELTDESLRLSDIRPVGRFLKLIEIQSGTHKTLDRQITVLIGSRGLMDMNTVPRAEVEDFRKRMMSYGSSRIPNRQDWIEMFKAKHPPRLRSSENLPEELMKKLNNGCIVYKVKVEETQACYTLKAPSCIEPEDAVEKALQKWSNRLGNVRYAHDYILKALGMEDYLYGSYPLHQFVYVYNCLQRNLPPEFWLLDRKKVFTPSQAPTTRDRNVINSMAVTPHRQTMAGGGTVKHRDTLVWGITEKFNFTIHSISSIEFNSEQTKENIDRAKVVVGLYHGNEVLGEVLSTKEYHVQEGVCKIDEKLTFDLAVEDVHHTCRLCFTLVGKVRGSKVSNPVSWVNIPVFDFRSRLVNGEHKLPLWPIMAEMQQMDTGCYPIGTVSLNPHGGIMLNVTFPDYGKKPPIIFPTEDMIFQCAAENMEPMGAQGSPHWKASKSHIEQMLEILAKTDGELCEQDKELIWMLRYECRDNYPHALPSLLFSVKWNNHIDVAKMQVLLSTWKHITVDQALELLDFNFPDKNVRKYAVDCLQVMRDDELSLYLLQLVQALKYETYLCCPLAEFLLERSLMNQHIGHQLFWLLKSEIQNPTVTVRFGLLLEIYLKVNPENLTLYFQQHEALTKLHAVSQLVKSTSVNLKNKDKWLFEMRNVLEQKSYQEKLTEIISPLSPLHRLQGLVVPKCKFMDSKKRPLWLIFKNSDCDGKDVKIIYKNGDDLRQDMLTLQMLQIMDSIWQSEGLDLRMNVYGCVATGFEQGMIEVIDGQTIHAIQKEQERTAFDKKALFEWLKDKNFPDEKLEQAVEEFMLSCAGYSVATYILGIGDRHNGNIMLKENGQLFHIDFGHFLGNFKKKMGIKRERVPFVLPPHFCYVILKGDEKDKEKRFNRFRATCEQAYLALRKRGSLLIRLFSMMISSGIPQLSSINDLDYLKETLSLHLNEDQARVHFLKKFNESVNSISVSFNWFAHNVAH